MRILNTRFLPIFVCGLFCAVVLATAAEGQPAGRFNDAIRFVKPPKYCTITIDSNEQGRHYRYIAPANNFEEPIRIQFEEQMGERPPDILLWVDEAHWHDTVQSGTAAGRIVVDDQLQYRIETTFVEFDRLSGQVFCPHRTTVIQRNPEGLDNRMVVESAVITFDQKGIRSARFDRVLEMSVVIPEEGNNPFDLSPPKKIEKKPEVEQIESFVQSGSSQRISPPVD